MVFNKREAIAIFSGKCFMLANVIYDDILTAGELSVDAEYAVESMFRQSEVILGEQ
jgi:hypothetical protein